MGLNKSYNTGRISKQMSKKSAIQKGLKQGDALSPFFFNLAFEYAIRRVQENQV
jgi:hypothetical protein